jgi:hypothetical protein
LQSAESILFVGLTLSRIVAVSSNFTQVEKVVAATALQCALAAVCKLGL